MRRVRGRGICMCRFNPLKKGKEREKGNGRGPGNKAC